MTPLQVGLLVVVLLLVMYFFYVSEHYYSPAQVEAVMRRERPYPFTVRNNVIYTDHPYPYKPPMGAHRLVSDSEFAELDVNDVPHFRNAMPADERSISPKYPPEAHNEDLFTDFIY